MQLPFFSFLGSRRTLLKAKHFDLSEPTPLKKDFTVISQFKTNRMERGYPETLVSTTLAEIKFEDRKAVLQQKCRQNMQIVPF